MSRKYTILFSLAGLLCLVSNAGFAERPNVLFIAIDDLNDWTSLYAPGNPIRTPNLERLARRGVFFSRAYCASPACNPSRVAVMTGLRPTTTGVYGNKSDWRRALPDAVTIPRHFMKNGYHAAGAGKIFHHHFDGAFHDKASFHEFQMLAKDLRPPKKLNGITNWVGGRGGGPTAPPYDWGPWPKSSADAPDVKTVDYARRFLARKHARPFFLAVGIFRPHSPWYAPAEHFSRYPLDELVLPRRFSKDLEDLPSGGRKMLADGKPFLFKTMVANKQWSNAVQGYQACASFADAQVGRLLDGLAGSPYAGNTIVVLWSDHGFHLGEKQHWEKFALWEKSTRCPLIVVAPGKAVPGGRCEQPVSLLDIYPTLIELCGLPKRKELEGTSLLPQLRDVQAERKRPVLTTWGRGNHAIRSSKWRFISYADGSSELYSAEADPNDWHNLLAKDGREKLGGVTRELRAWLPKKEAELVEDLVPKEGVRQE